MRRFVVLLLIGLVAPGVARAQRGPRFPGRLRMAASGMAPVGSIDRPGSTAARATVAVRCQGGAARLRALGFAVREGAGEVAFVDVGRDELRALRALPSVRSVEPSRRLRPMLDVSVPLTGATAVRRDAGLDGRGVLVGVVDTGVDFRHPDFQGDTGATRVAALLDLTHARGGLHPDLPGYGDGALWLAADLDAQLVADRQGGQPPTPVTQADVDGHGTHVAGIAAGNGRATGNGRPAGRYVGMAPGARLAIANATRDGHGFAQAEVLASIRFVFDTASRLGLPAVVNLSLGGDSGPHDGTTAFEQAIVSLAPADQPGRAVVVSAGNSGSHDRHASDLRLDGEAHLRIPFPAGASAGEALSIELWTSGPPPAITLVSPAGARFGPVAAGGVLDAPSGVNQVRIDASGEQDPDNGRWDAAITVSADAGQAVAAGTWELILAGKTGRWDAWITDADGNADPRFLDRVDPAVRADFPAYATSVLSAGSYVSRTGWATADGRTIARSTMAGASSAFTGTGPTADGRFFPDVAAPGDFVLSSLASTAPANSPASSFHLAGDTGYLVGDDGVHGALRGTSQAAPHVAGAVALLFQADPTLTPRRLRELLRTAAAVDAGGAGYTQRFGFGRLDVAAAVALLRRAPAGALDPSRTSVGLSREAVAPGDRAIVSVVPRDGSGAPIGPGHAVRIECAGDCRGATWEGAEVPLGEGRWERTLLAGSATGFALAFTVTVDGVAVPAGPGLWIVGAREQVGQSPRSGCGVGAGLAGGAGAPVLLALALGWLVGRTRRRSERPGDDPKKPSIGRRQGRR